VVTVTGTASDPEGVQVTVRYAISVPDDWRGADVDGGDWSFSWNVSDLTDGQYSVFVEASDGVHTTRIFAQYFVDNPLPPNRPPTVVIESPAEGEVSGRVSIRGTASDPDGDPITKVEVRFDAGLWQTASGTTSWSLAWDTRELGNGPVSVTVRAYDGEDWSEYVTFEYQVDNEDSGTQDGADWTLWVIVVVVVVVAAVAGWFLYSRRDG
jgi:hypothetical protein